MGFVYPLHYPPVSNELHKEHNEQFALKFLVEVIHLFSHKIEN